MDIAIYVQPHGVPCDTFFFFNDTATTEIYTLSLHDALPIYSIYKIAQTGYFATAMEDKTEPDGFIHSGAFLLIDKQKRIRGKYDGTKEEDVNRLIARIGKLRNE